MDQLVNELEQIGDTNRCLAKARVASLNMLRYEIRAQFMLGLGKLISRASSTLPMNSVLNYPNLTNVYDAVLGPVALLSKPQPGTLRWTGHQLNIALAQRAPASPVPAVKSDRLGISSQESRQTHRRAVTPG
jgi:hypothetical protein